GLVVGGALADTRQWASEQRRLRNALPPEVVATLDRLEAIGAYDDPEYERAEAVYMDRHFYRGPKPRAELERMRAERGREAYRAMCGPNEWAMTGVLRDWDVRERLGEITIPTLCGPGRADT